MFGEKKTERINGVDCKVWISPKYEESKKKAIELIESKKYGLSEADFWILQNMSKNGTCTYSGLIISHNGCLKINDALPAELKFNQKYCSDPIACEYTNGLRMDYRDEAGLYEVGEITPSNCKNAYPYAMLLKRLMDRVILKNSKVAFSGIYSEVEAEEFKEEVKPAEEPLTDEKVDELRAQMFAHEPEPMTNEQYATINSMSNEIHEWVKAKFMVKTWEDLDTLQAAELIRLYNAKKGRK